MSDGLLKVLLVDDEYMVRGLLKRCIDWNEIGMEIIGEASGAQEALELTDRLSPDIIFTDICMPYMDGIELSGLVFEKYPNIKIVILTGYEEFEYAKKSLKLGIADFLLKPINDDEIRKSALDMKKKIEAERSHSNEYNRLKTQLEENRPYMKEKFLNEFIRGDIPEAEVSEKLAYFDLNFVSGTFQAAFLEADRPHGDITTGAEEKLILRLQCMEEVRLFFRNDPCITVFFDNNQKIAVLNTATDIDFIECCETLRIMLANKIKCAVTIGIGNPCNGPENIRQTCREAIYALNYSAVLGKNQVISYSVIDLSQKKPLQLHGKTSEEFEFCIKAGLTEKALELFCVSCDVIGPEISDTAETMRIVSSNTISVILSAINETGLRISDVFEDGGEPFKQVFRIDTLPEMKEYISSVIRKTTELVEKLKTKKVNKTITDIKEYINVSISADDLSPASIAGKFYLNPSYLSRVFKQETGQTLTEYITKARMELAVRLLDQTDLKAYEIAERIGIQDPHYFSICFKKFTGMSVNDYRRLSGKS
ncbi:MAG TPA: response regulator [Clostridia bacterium]|nr:response regulator [Clostridia bacterium]